MNRKLSLFTFILYTLSFILFSSPALAATLSLSPSAGSFGKSCTFTTQVLIDTQGAETDGADVILLFDPAHLAAGTITNGSIYADFPGNTVDNSAGRVNIFALAPSTKGFTGRGVVATVSFTTIASASASPAAVRLDFDPTNLSKTTDSNVIQRSDLTDVLKSVTNGSYTINPASAGCTAAKTVVVTGAASTLADSGTWEVTLIAGSLGFLMVSFGVLGLRKVNSY